MTGNSRFAVSVHILSYLVYKQGRPCRRRRLPPASTQIRSSIRRLLSALSKPASSPPERRDGRLLAPQARRQHQPARRLPRRPPQARLRDEHIRSTITNARGRENRGHPSVSFLQGQSAMEAELGGMTIADVVAQLRPVCRGKH